MCTWRDQLLRLQGVVQNTLTCDSFFWSKVEEIKKLLIRSYGFLSRPSYGSGSECQNESTENVETMNGESLCVSSLHWCFSSFLCRFCSTGLYSDYTPSSSYVINGFLYFSNGERVRKVLAPPFSLRREG